MLGGLGLGWLVTRNKAEPTPPPANKDTFTLGVINAPVGDPMWADQRYWNVILGSYSAPNIPINDTWVQEIPSPSVTGAFMLAIYDIFDNELFRVTSASVTLMAGKGYNLNCVNGVIQEVIPG